jgi:glycosyltransferase involved in cell wall biosynthesis
LRGRGRERKFRGVTINVIHVDTERGWRGGERQALWLADELARRGVGTVVAARSGEPLAVRALERGLDTIACDPANELDPVAALRLRGEITRRGIHIVHAHTAHAVAVAALATLGTRARVVVARRVDFPLRRNIGTRLKYGRAAVMIAISRAVADVLERSGVDRARIRVVPDGVDLHRIVVPATRETHAALGIASGQPVVVQVAQLVGHKDPLNFVRALVRVRERVPGVQALLVGEGSLRPDVEREIQLLQLQSTLHLAGYRTDADALLSAADVVCLSSSEEGMGSVLLDALAFGKPIAATRAGGIPEVIVDGECGLLAPIRDPAALGDAISRLIMDDELRTRVAAAARLRAAQFSVERLTDRTLAVYESVLEGAAPG